MKKRKQPWEFLKMCWKAKDKRQNQTPHKKRKVEVWFESCKYLTLTLEQDGCGERWWRGWRPGKHGNLLFASITSLTIILSILIIIMATASMVICFCDDYFHHSRKIQMHGNLLFFILNLGRWRSIPSHVSHLSKMWLISDQIDQIDIQHRDIQHLDIQHSGHST